MLTNYPAKHFPATTKQPSHFHAITRPNKTSNRDGFSTAHTRTFAFLCHDADNDDVAEVVVSGCTKPTHTYITRIIIVVAKKYALQQQLYTNKRMQQAVEWQAT